MLLDICGVPEPKTGLEGKFSLRGTASLALNGIDTANPETYVDDVISSDAVQALIDKVTVETDDTLTNFQAKVVWVDKEQNAHEAFNDLSEPVSDYGAQGEKLKSKFVSLCKFADYDHAKATAQVSDLGSATAVELK